jgi:hypothetical protein
VASNRHWSNHQDRRDASDRKVRREEMEGAVVVSPITMLGGSFGSKANHEYLGARIFESHLVIPPAQQQPQPQPFHSPVLLHHNRRHDCLIVFLSRLQQYVGSALGVSKMFAIGPLARVFLQSGLLYAKLRHAQKGTLIGAVPQQRHRHHDSNNNEQQQ